MLRFLIAMSMVFVGVGVRAQAPLIPTPDDRFLASYYDNADLEGYPKFYTFEDVPEIFLANGIGPDGLGDDFYSIRWTGNFSFTPGNYLMRIAPDEGARLIVDGVVVIDQWDNTRPQIFETNVVFGETQNITVEFRDTRDFANLEFKIWNTSTWVQWPTTPDVNNDNCGLESDPGVVSYHIGHSLVNSDMPWFLQHIAREAGASSHRYGYQYILGSPLKYNWNNSSATAGVFGTDSRVELTTGNYNTLVLCEGGPIKSHFRWNDPVTYASNFYDLALTANPDTDLFIYATWPEYTECMTPGNWNSVLKDELNYWEMIVRELQARYPDKNVNMVPVGYAMGKLHDAVLRGRVPGVLPFVSDFKEKFFADHIHMTDLGNYFVALVHYATIYKSCPVDTPLSFPDFYGHPDQYTIDPVIAPAIQEIAWEAVREYELSGVE